MNKHFSLYLTIIFVSFLLVISFFIAFFDYKKVQEQINMEHEKTILLAEDEIVHSLHTIDQIYNLTDQNIAEEMKANSEEMLDMYKDDPEFEHWDFDLLKEKFEMDVYILNSENIIIYSSFVEDIGLNFDECCSNFGKLLHERRMNNTFHHDGMDIQQATGEIKKFSYMPTPDQKYLLELSVSLGEDTIFKQFNFFDTIALIKNEFDTIQSIQVYTPSGHVLGYTDSEGKPKKIKDDMRSVFREVLRYKEMREVVENTDKGTVTYRYIPYTANEKRGYSTDRVIEIIYQEAESGGLFTYYLDGFRYQLLFILVVAILLSLVITRLIAKPVYLAFHDSLSGLKNRAAFEVEIKKKLRGKNDTIALMMIDIDNFKSVNDELGHSEGDNILVHTANAIQLAIGDNGVAFRIGGDEFVAIFTNLDKNEIEQIAISMLKKINSEYRILQKQKGIDVSISIGIAYASQNDTTNLIYDRADKALYRSKENGKNQYSFY